MLKELEESTLVLSEKVIQIEPVKQTKKEYFKYTHCDFHHHLRQD
jgi:hypothetical protein